MAVSDTPTITTAIPSATINTAYRDRRWMPEQVLFTPDALEQEWGRSILERVESLGLPIERLKHNRLAGLRGETERETYSISKRTLAVVTAPASQLKLTPIPPSADWQFHIAQGCPAHCQYCYLAGSLQGPPVIRVYANLPEILGNLKQFERSQGVTSYEVSCYTDPLGIEHLSGSLAACIRYFGTRDRAQLRWVSKFANVDDLLDLPHNGNTRCRFSINAASISRILEGGTAPVAERLQAIHKLALPSKQGGGGYPVGLVIAPIMPIENWREEYSQLLDQAAAMLDFDCDLTFELISHRFTPGSKGVLQQWYPNSKLDLDETNRSIKRNKFGGVKYVYDKDTMTELRQFFEAAIAQKFPKAEILYWT
ncbi:MAG: spore photoproduct lyase [Elainellaceae cyanobacterium]